MKLTMKKKTGKLLQTSAWVILIIIAVLLYISTSHDPFYYSLERRAFHQIHLMDRIFKHAFSRSPSSILRITRIGSFPVKLADNPQLIQTSFESLGIQYISSSPEPVDPWGNSLWLHCDTNSFTTVIISPGVNGIIGDKDDIFPEAIGSDLRTRARSALRAKKETFSEGK